MNGAAQDPAPISICETRMSFQTFRLKLFCLAIPFLLVLAGCGESRSIAEADLDIPIMLKKTERGEPQAWMTLREWKERLAENPKIEVEERFSRDGEKFGLMIEFEDNPDEVVVLFEKRDEKLHPSLIGSDGNLLRVKSNVGQLMAAVMVKTTTEIKR